jgi:hypothetical protein
MVKNRFTRSCHGGTGEKPHKDDVTTMLLIDIAMVFLSYGYDTKAYFLIIGIVPRETRLK